MGAAMMQQPGGVGGIGLLNSSSSYNLAAQMLQVDNPYLIQLITGIMRRLLRIAHSRREEEEGAAFLRKVSQLVREGLEHYVRYYCTINQQ